MTVTSQSTPSRPRAVAQYLRMSTDGQSFSLQSQTDTNAAFAAARGWEIVRTYEDPGVSGLTLNARPGLKALLSDVVSGVAAYDAILVCDVSRWGRFQDLDQGAHYEFICREAGVAVIYSAEVFADDGSAASGILKYLKRMMAAEFSRDLAAKVRSAQRGLQARGYWIGGAPGFGLRRRCVSMTGELGMVMEQGQSKAVRELRTVLVPGPESELAVVRRIYGLFLFSGMRMLTIAATLNAQGVGAEGGAAWTRQRVRSVLTNEKYVGVIIGGKHAGAFGVVRSRRPPEDWSRVEGRLEPIVSRAQFDLVQRQLPTPKHLRPSDEVLLAELRDVLSDSGRLSGALIDRHPATRAARVYKDRFGGMAGVYERLGYRPSRQQRRACEAARLRTEGRFKPQVGGIGRDEAWGLLAAHFQALGRVSANTIDADPALPSADWYRARFGAMGLIYARLGYAPTAQQQRHMGLKAPGAPRYRPPA